MTSAAPLFERYHARGVILDAGPSILDRDDVVFTLDACFRAYRRIRGRKIDVILPG